MKKQTVKGNFLEQFKGRCELIPSSGLSSVVCNPKAQGIDKSIAIKALNLNLYKDLQEIEKNTKATKASMNFPLLNHKMDAKSMSSGLPELEMNENIGRILEEDQSYLRKYYPINEDNVIDKLPQKPKKYIYQKDITDFDREAWLEFKHQKDCETQRIVNLTPDQNEFKNKRETFTPNPYTKMQQNNMSLGDMEDNNNSKDPKKSHYFYLNDNEKKKLGDIYSKLLHQFLLEKTKKIKKDKSEGQQNSNEVGYMNKNTDPSIVFNPNSRQNIPRKSSTVTSISSQTNLGTLGTLPEIPKSPIKRYNSELLPFNSSHFGNKLYSNPDKKSSLDSVTYFTYNPGSQRHESFRNNKALIGTNFKTRESLNKYVDDEHANNIAIPMHNKQIEKNSPNFLENKHIYYNESRSKKNVKFNNSNNIFNFAPGGTSLRPTIQQSSLTTTDNSTVSTANNLNPEIYPRCIKELNRLSSKGLKSAQNPDKTNSKNENFNNQKFLKINSSTAVNENIHKNNSYQEKFRQLKNGVSKYNIEKNVFKNINNSQNQLPKLNSPPLSLQTSVDEKGNFLKKMSESKGEYKTSLSRLKELNLKLAKSVSIDN